MTLVKKSEFAEMANVSRAAISQGLRRGVIAAATDGRIDLSHPTNVKYLASKGKKPRAPKGAPVLKSHSEGIDVDRNPMEPVEKEVGIPAEQLLDMTLRDIYREFGTWKSVIGYVDAVNKLEQIIQRQTKTARERGDLIARDAVKRVFSFVDDTHARILADSPAALAIDLINLFQTEPTHEEVEDFIRKNLSKQVKGGKVRLRRQLQKLLGDDDAEPDE